MAIDESSRRRPGFRGDVAVELSDSQTWHLPIPRIRFRPARDDAGKITAKQSYSFGPEYLAKVEAYYEAKEDETEAGGERILLATLDLASAVLLANYDLTDDEVGELIQFDFGLPVDEANVAMRSTLLFTALGIEKKETEAGSATG